MTEVFVSYKRENLAAVNRLVEALRAEGVSVWWDQDIPPNAPWEGTIERELVAAKLVIVAWSPAAVASDNVKAEARWARGQGRLLQVFVEPCEPPLFFGERQGVDLNGWSGGTTHPAFLNLLQAIRAGPASVPEAAANETSPAPLPLPSKPSIAVMPFANLSGDPEQDYFADGMVTEITTALSRIRSIFVIASGSTLSFKGKAVRAQEVGRQLGVRYVLEGNVRKSGNRVRIAVQLIDALDGAQVWADRFEDTLDDIFTLQDTVAQSVAGVIEPTVQIAEIRRAARRPTDSMGSYDLYLRALPIFRGYNKASTLEAFGLLERAVALDPNNAPALSLAALCHTQFVGFGWTPDPEPNRREGIELAHRALKTAPDDAYVLSNCSSVAGALEGDFDTAITLADRAIALNPGSALARLAGGMARMRIGQVDLAAAHLEAAIRLDPLGPDRPAYTAILAQVRFYQRRFAEAVVLEREAAQQNEYPLIRAFLAASYGHLGRKADALEALAEYRSRTQRPIEDVAHRISRDPDHIKLFLDGIALAEGQPPSST
jgi:adenylate cyclase